MDSKGEVLSFWIPKDLKEELNQFCESYSDKSRSHYISDAIEGFLADPVNRYLVDRSSKTYYEGEEKSE